MKFNINYGNETLNKERNIEEVKVIIKRFRNEKSA